MGQKTEKEEGIFGIIAALAVLVTAIWGNYLVSTVIAIITILFFTEQVFSDSNKKKK